MFGLFTLAEAVRQKLGEGSLPILAENYFKITAAKFRHYLTAYSAGRKNLLWFLALIATCYRNGKKIPLARMDSIEKSNSLGADRG